MEKTTNLLMLLLMEKTTNLLMLLLMEKSTNLLMVLLILNAVLYNWQLLRNAMQANVQLHNGERTSFFYEMMMTSVLYYTNMLILIFIVLAQ
jgi:hypothetical protein